MSDDYRAKAAHMADQLLAAAGLSAPPSMDPVLDIIGRAQMVTRHRQPMVLLSKGDFVRLLELLSTAEAVAELAVQGKRS